MATIDSALSLLPDAALAGGLQKAEIRVLT